MLFGRALIFLGGAVMLALAVMSGWELATQPGLDAARAARKEALTSAPVEGRLEEVWIQQDIGAGDTTHWHPSRVRYRYDVAGVNYTGDRFSRAITGYGDTANDDLTIEGVEAKLAPLARLSDLKREGPIEAEGK